MSELKLSKDGLEHETDHTKDKIENINTVTFEGEKRVIVGQEATDLTGANKVSAQEKVGDLQENGIDDLPEKVADAAGLRLEDLETKETADSKKEETGPKSSQDVTTNNKEDRDKKADVECQPVVENVENTHQTLNPVKDAEVEEEEKTEEDNDEDDNEDLEPIPEDELENLDGGKRNALFEKALVFSRRHGKKNLALVYFLKCLTGLTEEDKFTYLPQCLHNVAEIYYARGEFEKAVQFIQAEKMYYETALIDTADLQRRIEETSAGGDGSVSGATADSNIDLARAKEYETLARFCLEKKQPQMALEYQGKATKIRQQILGGDHQDTIKSLDFFTLIYAEVGKEQYSESMQKLASSVVDGVPAPQNIEVTSSSHTESSPPSILRNRKKQEIPARRNHRRSVHFQEINQEQVRQEEEWITRRILWIFFVLVAFVLTVLLLSLYCRSNPRQRNCLQWKNSLHYYYMRLKYLVYYYMSPNQAVG